MSKKVGYLVFFPRKQFARETVFFAENGNNRCQSVNFEVNLRERYII